LNANVAKDSRQNSCFLFASFALSEAFALCAVRTRAGRT